MWNPYTVGTPIFFEDDSPVSLSTCSDCATGVLPYVPPTNIAPPMPLPVGAPGQLPNTLPGGMATQPPTPPGSTMFDGVRPTTPPPSLSLSPNAIHAMPNWAWITLAVAILALWANKK
jgi:hypothetical protein